MVLFNYSTKELTAKIVYYGPGLCGKTTNLQFIYESLPEDKKGRMLSLSTQTDRTLYFDFLPVELGDIRGMKTRVQLYTVPGQVFYNETRKMVLKGVDGVVFVADSQAEMADANVESFRNLEENLLEHGLDLATMPLVLQFNKRDLPTLQSVEEMNAGLNRYNSPFYEAIATTGIGVHDTLKAVSKLVLLSLSGRYEGDDATDAPPETPEPSPAEVAPPAGAAVATDAPVTGDNVETEAADSWTDTDLEDELDQMDAEEIQGLLEEVESFDGEPISTQPPPAEPARTDAGETLFTDLEEAAPEREEENFAFAPAAEEPEAPAAEAGPAEEPTDGGHAVWLGEDPGVGAGTDLPASGGELSFDEQAEPLDGEPTDLFQDEETPAEPAPEPGVAEALMKEDPPVEAGSPGGALSFESFLADKRAEGLVDSIPEDGDEPTAGASTSPPDDGHGEAPALEADAVTAAPVIHSGAPVISDDGELRVPLQLEIGGRQLRYTLCVNLRAESESAS
jgi:signal recognition particle receptor subunit beta